MIFSTILISVLLSKVCGLVEVEAATSSSSYSPQYAALVYAYGKDRVSTFIPDEESFQEALAYTANTNANTNAEESRHYVVCSRYAEGRESEVSLGVAVGEENVHPVYSSHKEDKACFLAYTTKEKMDNYATITNHQNVWAYTVVPSVLKIHHTALHMLKLGPETKPDVLRSYGLVFDEYNLADSDIAVSYHLGNAKSKNSPMLAEMIKEHTQRIKVQLSNEPSLHVSNLPNGHVRKLFEVETNVRASCGFDKLSVESEKHMTRIRNFAVQENSKYCYSNLLTMLMNFNAVIDVRITPPKKVLNHYTKAILQSGLKSSSSSYYVYHNAGLVGTNQIIGVGDSGVDDGSCFFANADSSTVPRSTYKNPTYDLSYRKVIQYVAYMNGQDVAGGHGSHVCGTIAGESLSSNSGYDGNAKGAKIAFFDMSKDGDSIQYPSPITDNVFDAAYDTGARLHSNSWGSPLNAYDSDSVYTDDYHVENQEFLALFAAGNDGSRGYYTIGSPAVTKNILTVGASRTDIGSIDQMAYFSSIGPTFDGRIKPDIVAPGYYTTSCNSGGSTSGTCSIVDMAGTSMATPAVAGSAALIRQYFMDSNFWATMCDSNYDKCGAFTPKGATVKAAIIHSGENMTRYSSENSAYEPSADLVTLPDYYQGFGRVFLQNVLPYTGIETVLDLFVDELVVDAWTKQTFTVTVTDTTRPVKATIVWMDPANSVISSKMLLNDLDLTISRGGVTWYGNNVIGDELNNVEQVTITNPQVGEYVVTVYAKEFLSLESQAVSIVITSGGSVTSVSASSAITSEDSIYCASGTHLVNLRFSDRGGDGWGSGNYVTIKGSSGSVVYSSGMSSTPSNDISVLAGVCLSEGSYTVQLTQGGSFPEEMGFDVTDCSVYLSAFDKDGAFTLNSNGECNACSDNTVAVTLYGSEYAIPYGWKPDSHYTITSGGDTVLAGTLVSGIVDARTHCLPNGKYVLSFEDVPDEDDYINDIIGAFYGVEGYSIKVSSCGSAASYIPPNSAVNIQLSEGSCTSSDKSAGSTVKVGLFTVFTMIMIPLATIWFM